MERERRLQAAAAKAIASPGAFLGDAHSLLQSVYKCVDLPLQLRVDAAKAAIAYERPRLAPVLPPEPPEALTEKAQRLHQLLAEMKSTIGGGNGHAAALDGDSSLN